MKNWLASQNKPNVQSVFIGQLVTELCLGLGLDADLTGEKVEAEMKAFTVQDFFAMNLRLGGDDAPLIGDKEEEEDDDGNEEQQQQGGEVIPHGGPVMMDWESVRSFLMVYKDDWLDESVGRKERPISINVLNIQGPS
ncbi:hypothetical protein ABN226_18535 [Morganella morganii]|uniref:hypothetical protein n=1 Tax=Morganella morganii TaxID=582 RepID=UPI0032DA0DA5